MENLIIWIVLAAFCIVLIFISLLVSVSAWSEKAGRWVQRHKVRKPRE
ncbi:MAG: hypothetical protein K8S54_06260 [Spirochaetia bacterium]|nr:hypothetical protein [Spirochaetia bacterium]